MNELDKLQKEIMKKIDSITDSDKRLFFEELSVEDINEETIIVMTRDNGDILEEINSEIDEAKLHLLGKLINKAYPNNIEEYDVADVDEWSSLSITIKL